MDKIITTSSFADLHPGDAARFSIDWATRGDWVGRYGTRLAILCAAGAPFQHEIINDWTYKYDYEVGAYRTPDDTTRHWIQWARTTDPRVLWDPVIGARRESEWDDHGETYSPFQEGPDIWVNFTVPAGVHRLTGYFVNYNGEAGVTRYRDYIVDILPYCANTNDALALAPLASARIRENWGGEYQSFLICGSGRFYMHIRRNNSFNTMVSSVMIDKVLGPPTPLEGVQCTYCASTKYGDWIKPPPCVTQDDKAPQGTELLRKVWSDLTTASAKRFADGEIVADRIRCYRALVAKAHRATDARPFAPLLAWWRRSLPMQTDEDRDKFVPAMAEIYAAEIIADPDIKRIH